MALRENPRLNQSFERSRRSPSRKKSFPWVILLLPLLWLGYKRAEGTAAPPQAMLVLGGSPDREQFAAQFAQQHPDLPIWVSSGSPRHYSEWVFSEAGIRPERLTLNFQAVDTVTNFTTLVDELQSQGIHSVYLITSDYHMRRAQVIGEIVFGSRGIHLKPVAIPSQRSPESLDKTIRDGARAILWVTTGRTGVAIRPASYDSP